MAPAIDAWATCLGNDALDNMITANNGAPGGILTVYYFAYGSNMSTPRLQQRVPSALAVAVASLHGHRLRFHKAGRDGSGKCDVILSTRPEDVVHGVVYRMDRRQNRGWTQQRGWVRATRRRMST